MTSEQDPEFARQVRALRLAQALADGVRASDVPEEDWPRVLAHLAALLSGRTGPPPPSTASGEAAPGL